MIFQLINLYELLQVTSLYEQLQVTSLYELLQWTTFVCTVRSDNFCIHCCIWKQQLIMFSSIVALQLHYIITIADSYWHYCNQLLVYTLLKLLTSISITSNDNLCTHYFTWQLFYALLQLNLHTLLQLRYSTSRRSEILTSYGWGRPHSRSPPYYW